MTEALTCAEWRKNRGTYIGGSDVAAIMGVSPYRNVGEVWLEKVRAQERLESGDDEPGDPEMETRFSRWGKRWEGVVLDEYADVAGVKELRRPGLHLYRHPDYPFIGGTIDAEATTNFGDRITVEAKTTDAFFQSREKVWGDQGTDEVPPWYVPQVVQYMLVRAHLGYDTRTDIPVLIGGNDFRIYQVSYDRELAEQMIEIQIWFWGLVTRREAPPMDFSATGATKLQKRIHDKIIGVTLVVTEEKQRDRILSLIALRDYAHEQGKKWAGDDGQGGIKGAATAELLSIVGDNARLEIPIHGKKPVAINRKPKAGYTVAAFDVAPSVTMSYEPYQLKARRKLFDEIQIEVPLEGEEQKQIEGSGE